ncbi:hypothetical protein [Allorhodopirellula solitaria]|uniref:SGNH hydrolase-type esterase domain-containing protein n=1 Tax=Allorhodopirellula solitaria TaxID=2527987 RepID=A0A5C5YKP2_9BACT|nr:hypothetical protein [Allorhodopirellula solitaria]TWT75348.1 hypothetical protein CA85_06390 [Allorhodopirellula solitaria]
MIRRWVLGSISGTLIVWLTSPLFVRSYHSRVVDPATRQWVYPAGTEYRWRSEGYATTVFGQHGMPGRQTLPTTKASRVIALWGDSQAEGVCVADEDKLWRVLQEQLSTDREPVDVLPLARSGADAADWMRSFEAAETQMGVTEHFLLLCELEDLLSITGPILDSMPATQTARGDKMLDMVPDFVLDAARGLLFAGESTELRQLRFGIGPAPSHDKSPAGSPPQPATFSAADIATTLAQSTSKPVTVVYAPRVPAIMGGQVRWEDPQDSDFRSLASELRRNGVRVINCRGALRISAESGDFPHGFQNGLLGNGHLNPIGYQAIAETAASETPRKVD